MGLVLKHVKRKPNGGYEYRRRVPNDVVNTVGKREFKKVLGATETEALHRYLKTHEAVERQIASARRLSSRHAAASRGELGGLALWEIVEERVANLLTGSIDPDEVRDIIAEHILANYPRGLPDGDTEGDPIGVTELDRLTAELLRNPYARKPQPTLQDAYDKYVELKLDPSMPDEHRKATQHLERVFKLVKDALGGMPPLAEISRPDARKVLDHMLVQRKANGELLSPTSVQRNMTIVRSVVNVGLVELGLESDVKNHFSGLSIKGVDNKGGAFATEFDKQEPIPAEILKLINTQINHGANQELQFIWRILQGTGCRLSEVRGLRCQDVFIEHEVPHIHIVPHAGRRLKNKASIRRVPLLADAFVAASEALSYASGNEELFQRYNGRTAASAVSGALMKHVRLHTDNSKHVVNSLRHQMKDALLEAGVEKLLRDLVLGHALESVGDKHYGGQSTRLRVTKRALERALKVGGGAS